MRHPIIGIVGAAGLVLALPGIAHAHTFNLNVNCAGITWTAQQYQPEQTNSITVTIDGATVYHDPNFGASDTGSRSWSPTVAHTWRIVVDAPGTQFDHDRTGAQPACQTTTSSTTTTSTTITTTSAPIVTTTIPDTTTTSTAPSSTSTAPTSTPTTTASTAPTSVSTPPSSSTTSVPPSQTQPSTAPPEALDALPTTGGGIDPWAPIAIILLGAFLTLATRRRPTP